MSLKLRKRTRSLACILPGIRSSSISTCKGHWRKAEDEEDDDDRSHLLMEDNTAKPDGKPYDLEKQDDQLFAHEELHPLNDTVSSDGTSCSSRHTPTSKAEAVSPAPGMAPSDSSSLGDNWPQFLPELELDHESMNSISSLPSSLKSMSFSAPNSPYLSTHSSATTSSFYSLSSTSHGSNSTPVTPTRTSRLPLTSPLPRRPQHRKSYSTSNILLPLELPPPPCAQVQTTLTLLKSIKNQIKALKRRESHLSTKLHVQRRERQQMQEQIAHLEARRLRVEALFLRPLPLVLLLPVERNEHQHEYDVCLVSEGQDAWNALLPLIRIQLLPEAIPPTATQRGGDGVLAMLLHFGPTLTQPMAATVSFLPPPINVVDEVDLQPLVRQMDFPFWDRVTCGHVLEATPSRQLSSQSCQILVDALMVEHKHLWRDQWTPVVDKKTRRIQWILQAEVDSLYYERIPSSTSSTLPPMMTPVSSSALVELD